MNIILSTYSTMYWITTSDAIITTCILLSIVSTIIPTVLLFGLPNDKECRNRYKPIMIISGIIAIITLLIAIFLPSERQWYKIYGIRKIEYVKNNPKAQQLPNKTINALDTFVDTTKTK